MSVMASPGVGGCRVCAVRFVCGVCYWVLDGIGDRTGGSTEHGCVHTSVAGGAWLGRTRDAAMAVHTDTGGEAWRRADGAWARGVRGRAGRANVGGRRGGWRGRWAARLRHGTVWRVKAKAGSATAGWRRRRRQDVRDGIPRPLRMVFPEGCW